MVRVCTISMMILLGAAAATASPQASGSRIEELIVWKMSDELKLDIKTEKDFSDIFKDLNAQKSELIKQQTELVQHISKLSTPQEKKLWIEKYQSVSKKISDISQIENSKMLKILGSDKYISYVALKSDLSQRVKSLMTTEKPEKKKSLPPPVVIEEK